MFIACPVSFAFEIINVNLKIIFAWDREFMALMATASTWLGWLDMELKLDGVKFSMAAAIFYVPRRHTPLATS